MYALTNLGELLSFFDMIGEPHFYPNPCSGLATWWEDDAIVISLEMPGFEKDKISVLTEGGSLTVSAAREESEEEGKDYLIRSRYPSREFARRFQLPDGLSLEKCECKYENGILEVRIEKSGDNKAKKIDVK